MVPFDETLHGRAQRCVGDGARVYSFAASGAPLSQYLIWAEHARQRYEAQGLVFVVIGNDFDESLAKCKQGPGFHHFVEGPAGSLVLRLFDYSPGGFRKTLRHSALARYLVLHLHVEATAARLWRMLVRDASAGTGPQFLGNTSASTAGTRVKDSERAIDAFFDEFPQRTGLPPARMLFVLDGVRPTLYGGAQALAAVDDDYFSQMRRYFVRQARERGYEVIDLQPLFIARHEADGTVFEFEDDAHWNGRGHEIAARAILDSGLARTTFQHLSLDGRDCPPPVR